MANRIVGNVLIVDSAMGNNTIILNSQMKDYEVNAISFWSANSTGALLLTENNTATDIVFKLDGSPLLVQNPRWYPFSIKQSLGDLKVPILTAGTAFLYLA